MPKFKVKFSKLIEQTGELIVEAESRAELAKKFAWNDLVAYGYLNPKGKIKWKYKHTFIDGEGTYIDEETDEAADISITELPEILLEDERSF